MDTAEEITLLSTDIESNHTYHADASSVTVDEVREEENDDNQCVICLEPIREYSAYYFDCSHKLHNECFHQYFAYNYDVENNFICCPVCIQEIHVEIVRKHEHDFQSLRMIGALTESSFSVWLLLKYLNYSENFT